MHIKRRTQNLASVSCTALIEADPMLAAWRTPVERVWLQSNWSRTWVELLLAQVQNALIVELCPLSCLCIREAPRGIVPSTWLVDPKQRNLTHLYHVE